MGTSKSKAYLEDRTAITAFYLQKKDSSTAFTLLGEKERK
jgi:hypothetical protein